MIFSNQGFENGRTNSILIEFLFSFLFLCHFFSDNFLSKLLLWVLSWWKTETKLTNLALETIWWKFLAV
jgi:hypothetical protein